jgi:RimJ/RimL family protein N-acetyltransferase
MIRVEKLNHYKDIGIFNELAKWDNDPEIRSYITPNMSGEPIDEVTGDELMCLAIQNESKHIYLVYDEDLLIGMYSIDTDFEYRVIREDHIGWIGIVIGHPDYRGKGLGPLIMKELEASAQALGCKAIELGVFDFNERAYKLYKKLGYREIKRIENFVFYQGQWHSDIRMLKEIVLEKY